VLTSVDGFGVVTFIMLLEVSDVNKARTLKAKAN